MRGLEVGQTVTDDDGFLDAMLLEDEPDEVGFVEGRRAFDAERLGDELVESVMGDEAFKVRRARCSR